MLTIVIRSMAQVDSSEQETAVFVGDVATAVSEMHWLENVGRKPQVTQFIETADVIQ